MGVCGFASVALVAWATWHASANWFRLDEAVYVLGSHHLGDGQLYHVGLPTIPHLPFTYPPVAALAFWPLSILPDGLARIVWCLVEVLSLVAILGLSLTGVAPEADRRRVWLWSAALCAPAYLLDPVRLTIYFGQINLVLCALLLWDLTRPIRLGRHTLPQGVIVGLAGAIKLVPLIFVPFLAVTGRVRAALWAVAAFFGASLVAVAVIPGPSWAYWTRYVRDASRVGEPGFFLNQSVVGMGDRLIHHHLAPGVAAALQLVVIVLGLTLARWAWVEGSAFLGMLICASTGLLASPISWQHHLVWAVPVVVWLVVAPDRPKHGALWAGGAWFALWLSPLEWTGGEPGWAHMRGWRLVASGSSFLLLVGFMVACAALVAVRRRTQTI
jgi:alpha-1,2-mannosyltransferase